MLGRAEADLAVCRRPVVVPEGWRFRPLAEDRLVVVCSPRHPLAGARRIGVTALERATRLLPPAGLVARERFDALAATFSREPKVHPLVTRALAPVRALLRRGDLLGLMPLRIVAHLVEAGELVALPFGGAQPLAPLGLIEPADGGREAVARLAEFVPSPSVTGP